MAMFYQAPAISVNTPKPWDESRLGWLALAWFDGFGTRTLHRLAKRYGGRGDKALACTLEDLLAANVTEKVAARFFGFRRETDTERLARKMEEEGVSLMLDSDEDYPPRLKQISDPPFALFVRGPKIFSELEIAIVGTRNCTPYGRNVTIELAHDLARSGLGIVSGLALGVDAYAHGAALEDGGRCIAVLGGGCDDGSIYPRHNLKLAQEILGGGGTIISEFPPGTFSLKHHFPLRNRIIAGLCRAVVVVEAAEESGSLITAHLALEQNRDVFAVPGPITSEQSRGTNKLLKLGAIPCTGAADILTHLELTADSPKPRQTVPLTPEEEAVCDALDQPRHADELGRILDLDAATIATRLMGLELKGRVKSEGGQMYTKSRH
ncbi:DNA-protecting protein DprA [Candidatus Uhrbacteria bacterium]|nr:DNA-protecting protein DprA [Candidatus Uhrbacteria bacterium]